MTYQQATQRLHELAGDKYCSISYETRKSCGDIYKRCCLYTEDARCTAEAETWEAAFEKLAELRVIKEIPDEQGPDAVEAVAATEG